MSETNEPTSEPSEAPAPSAPSAPVICPTCKHEAKFDGDASKAVIVCSECGTRIAFGVAQPRVVVEPQGPFIVLRLSGVAVTDKNGARVELADVRLDRQFAKMVGLNILSVT